VAIHAPKHLTPSSKRIYRRLVDEYDLGREVHALEVLRLALEAVDRADECRAILARDGVTQHDRFGQVKPHPLLKAEHDAAVRAARMFRELSLDGAVDDVRVPRTNGARS
jgi:P27 family predicted phage terminase small subunit